MLLVFVRAGLGDGSVPVAPELLDLAVWHQDTTEGDEGSEDDGVGEGGEDGVGGVGGDHLADARVDELVDQLCLRQFVVSIERFVRLTMTKNVLPAYLAAPGKPAV